MNAMNEPLTYYAGLAGKADAARSRPSVQLNRLWSNPIMTLVLAVGMALTLGTGAGCAQGLPAQLASPPLAAPWIANELAGQTALYKAEEANKVPAPAVQGRCVNACVANAAGGLYGQPALKPAIRERLAGTR